MLMAVALPLMSALIFSCQKDSNFMRKGDPIDFSIASSGSTITRTAYSGQGSDDRERIDWCSGDILRIHCPEARTEEGKKLADYAVDGDGESSGAISSTTILVVEGDFGLMWTDASEYTFTSVCPSPSVTGRDDAFGEGDNATTLTGHIPGDQTPASVTKNGTLWTAAPDMTNQYLVAKSTVTKPESSDRTTGSVDNVLLDFYPLTTAIRFTIENGTDKTGDNGDMYIDAVSVISAAGRIHGEFTANLEGWNGGATVPACNATGTGAVSNQEVKLDLNGKNVLLKDGEKLTFTLFLLPTQNVDDLTFKIYRHDKDGNHTWMSTRLAYNDAERTGVLFRKHTLTEVNGILIPDGARWQVKYAPEVGAWDSEDEGGKTFNPEDTPMPFVTSWLYGDEIPAVMTKYYYTFNSSIDDVYGHAGGSGSLEVLSTKEATHNTDEAVLWHLEYYDDETSEWIVPDEEPYYIKDFVSFSQVSGTSLSEQTVTVDVKAADAAKGEVISSVSHTDRLRDASLSAGTESAPYDLSMHDIHGNARQDEKPVTANCYVISHPGVYAFPLVYGNGVDYTMAPAGGDNANAYDPGSEMQPTEVYLTRFLNADGMGIRSPYIETDLKVDNISGWQAYPVWQDTPSNALISGGTCTILSREAAAAKGLTSCNSGYVMFTVPSDALVQGNAVVALSDGVRTLWSWHLWFTDNDLTPSSVRTDDDYQIMNMLPVNLGWVDGTDAGETYYKGKSLKIRLVQDGSKATREYTIVRKDESTCTHTIGSSPYYQWGRKDPFIRAFYKGGSWTEHDSGDITLHDGSSPAVSKVEYSEETSSLAYSILHPTHFVYSDEGMWYHELSAIGNDAHFYNLWSALNGSAGSGVLKDKPIKTIYDPCPPGYQVPQGNAFTHFSTSQIYGDFQNGYYFKTGFSTLGTDNTIFFNAVGCREYGSGNLDYQPGAAESGCYWTAAPNSAAMGYYLTFAATASPDANRVLPNAGNKWSNGLSIRPVKE